MLGVFKELTTFYKKELISRSKTNIRQLTILTIILISLFFISITVGIVFSTIYLYKIVGFYKDLINVVDRIKGEYYPNGQEKYKHSRDGVRIMGIPGYTNNLKYIYTEYYENGNVKYYQEKKGGEIILKRSYSESGELMSENQKNINQKGVKKNELTEKDGLCFYNETLFTGIGVLDGFIGLNEFEYKEGKLIQIRRFYSDGKKLSVEKPNQSVIKSWYESGKIKEDNTGEVSIEYYESGKIKVKTTNDLRESFYESGNVESTTKKFVEIPSCKIEEGWFEDGGRKWVSIWLENTYHGIYNWDENGGVVELFRFRFVRIVDRLEDDGVGLTYCIIPQETDENRVDWENGDRKYLFEICFDKNHTKIGFNKLDSVELESEFEDFDIDDFNSIIKEDIVEFGGDLEKELENYNFDDLINDFINKYRESINQNKKDLKDVIKKINEYLKL